MAKTWLDEECADLVKRYQDHAQWRNQTLKAALSAGVFQSEKELKSFQRDASYIDILRLLAVIKSSAQFDEVQENPDVKPETLVGALSAGWIASSLGVDTLEIYEDKAREAIQPTAELVARLKGLKAPKLSADDELGFSDRVWYFDFPQQAFPLQEVSIQSRQGGPVPILYLRAAIWHPIQRTVTSIFEIAGQRLYIHGYLNQNETDLEFLFSNSFRSTSDAANVQMRVFNMILLLAMYFLTQEQQGSQGQERAISGFKRVDLGDLDYKRAHKKLKGGMSLFSLKQLSAVKGESLPERASGERGDYDYAFEVTGHFRWQPYGTGRQQRKLIWIEPFVKGKGKGEPVQKTRLTRLT